MGEYDDLYRPTVEERIARLEADCERLRGEHGRELASVRTTFVQYGCIYLDGEPVAVNVAGVCSAAKTWKARAEKAEAVVAAAVAFRDALKKLPFRLVSDAFSHEWEAFQTALDAVEKGGL